MIFFIECAGAVLDTPHSKTEGLIDPGAISEKRKT